MTAPSVLVTGSTGNVGSVVVQTLLDAGLKVRAAARSPERIRERFGDVDAVAFDFTDPATWAAAFAGVHSMLIVRPPQLGRPRTQMLPALEVARRAGVAQMVLLSLQGAESNRFVPHATLESWLRDSALDWTFVRASFFMQNLSTTHRSDILDRDEIVVPAGNGATAFVDAVDVGHVAAAALLDPQRHRRRAWTPTSPAALTYRQVAAELSDVLGRPITYRRPGIISYLGHARRSLHLPWGMVAVTTAIYTVARLGKAGGLTDDVAEVLGRPPTSFRQFATRAGRLESVVRQSG